MCPGPVKTHGRADLGTRDLSGDARATPESVSLVVGARKPVWPSIALPSVAASEDVPAEGPRFSEEKHATCTLAAPARICAHAIDVKAARPELSRPTEARSPAMTEQDAFSLRSANDRCETAPHSPVESLESPVAAFRPRRVALGRTCGGCRYAPAPSAKPFIARRDGAREARPGCPWSELRREIMPSPDAQSRARTRLSIHVSTRESPRSPRLRRRDPADHEGSIRGSVSPLARCSRLLLAAFLAFDEACERAARPCIPADLFTRQARSGARGAFALRVPRPAWRARRWPFELRVARGSRPSPIVP